MVVWKEQNSSFFLTLEYILMMIKGIVDYIKDNKLKIKYVDNSVNIANYDNILEINDNIVTIINDKKIVNIRGNNLKLCKLLDNEILITGIIKKIEL